MLGLISEHMQLTKAPDDFSNGQTEHGTLLPEVHFLIPSHKGVPTTVPISQMKEHKERAVFKLQYAGQTAFG